ncbi:ABC transporter permease [Opitutus terrae]|uniref:Permease n=1 Tax=Opitutus terrae (strain DSM 11246 / JCM 15787 / PB90-1) TaxID=452637 RepID=B1ZXY0_OPITP|nr:ABC transporter permease [Opitutus terrae]ACB75182.1 permease [Opitutus terrae PB90-1]
MLSDLRFALRTLAKTPGFTALAILTLALGIGANAAIFALIHGVVLRPVVPVRPDEVVNLFTARQGASRDYRQFSHAEYLALREAQDTFADVAATNAVLTGIGEGQNVRRSFAFFASENFFSMLGTTPAVGRFFSADESRPNASVPVLIASYNLWQRFGGRPDFVGSTLRLNGASYTVIGVTRPGFSGLNALLAPDVWLPLGQFAQFSQPFASATGVQDLADPRTFTLNLTARLAPGVTLANLGTRLPALAQRLNAVQPADLATSRELQFEPPSRFSISTTPSGDSSGFMLAATMSGMAGCVLLIASLNLANMLLARGSARRREIAVRLALGATRGRIVRQLFVEGLVLALIGAALGLLLALWSNDLLLNSLQTLFSTMNFSLAVESTPSPAVLTATCVLALVATVLFSVGPALRATRVDLVNDLKQQGAASAATGRLNRFFAPRHLLVMAQIALSLMLLFTAGLFFRGALAAGDVQLGFEPRGQLVAELDFSLSNSAPQQAAATMFSALQRVRELPGVTAVAIGTQLPYGNVTDMPRFADAAAAPAAKTNPDSPEPGVDALLGAVTPQYFAALGVAVLRGRTFSDNEAQDDKSPRVAIIDEAFARKIFGDQDPIGRRIRYLQPRTDGTPAEMEIVGVCGSHRHDALQRTDRPRVFVPFSHAYQPSVFIHVRIAAQDRAAELAALTAVRGALLSTSPDLPLLLLAPMRDLLDRNIQLWIVRLGAVLFGVFGAIALLLAAIGVYGVKAYTVARRTREFGIRIAIGARPGDVFALVMRQAVLQTVFAAAIGLLLALAAGRLVGQLLYQVSPSDPLVLGIAAAFLTVSALLACFVPARRATKVQPIEALRTE